ETRKLRMGSVLPLRSPACDGRLGAPTELSIGFIEWAPRLALAAHIQLEQLSQVMAESGSERGVLPARAVAGTAETIHAAVCHDLGKLFELDVRGKGETWCPLDEPYAQFGRRTKTPVASWRPEREHGAHAKLSSFLMHHILSRADIAYLGLPRFVHLASCLSD